MDKQLKNLELYKEDNHSYLVDGIIKFYSLKYLEYQNCLITESVLSIAQLKKEHNAYLMKNIFTGVTPASTLSTIVNPSILKLIKDEDKTDIHLLGLFYCDPSTP